MTLVSLQLHLSHPHSHLHLHKLKIKPKPISHLHTTQRPTISKQKLPSLKVVNSSTKPSFHSLNAIKPYLLTQRESIIKGWLCSLLSVFALSKIAPKVGNFSSFLSLTNVGKLKSEGLVLGVLVVVRLVGAYWQQAFLWDAALNAVYRMRLDVFEKVLRSDMRVFESGVCAGDVAYRITAEGSDVADTIYALLNTIVPSTLQLSAIATQMLLISPVLSFISALVIPCMGLVIAFLGERLRNISKRAKLRISILSAYLNEVLRAVLFVKANSAEWHEYSRFQRLARADLSEHLKKKKMKVLIPEIAQMIYFCGLVVFCVGSLMVSGGTLDGCGMVSFITLLVLLVDPIKDVGKAYNEWKQGEPAIERLFDLTRFESKVIEDPSAVSLTSITGDIKFCDISFRYGDDSPLILNNLNLHIRAGETVALVGPSGGGKTTLVKLLLRLYDPSSGHILVDNNDIQSVRLDSLRRNIGLVSQDITIFSGSVAQNIGYRDMLGKIDMERVEHVARIANADEFIRELPEGYDTNIGPRGSVLSGGQSQRLAIARALYQDSTILILDEATSALDSRSELLVRQALQRLMENHTVLVIAHRLETVRMAKRVFFLNNGKLEELTHLPLLDSNYDSLASTGIVI